MVTMHNTYVPTYVCTYKDNDVTKRWPGDKANHTCENNLCITVAVLLCKL